MDIHTLVVVLILVSSASALLIIAMHRFRFSAEGTLHWAWGYGLSAAGFLGMACRGLLPDMVTIVLANTATTAAYLAIIEGVRRFTGRPPFSRPLGAVILASVTLYLSWFTLLVPSLGMRTCFLSILMAGLSGLVARDLLSSDRSHAWPARRLLGAVMAFNGLQFLGRLAFIARKWPSNELFAPDGGTAALFLATIVVIVLSTVGVVLMVAEKLQADVKILRGLLPICSYCRRVRDDAGYWGEIEAYVRTHAGTQFSHGVCPTCYEKQLTDLEGEEAAAPAEPPSRG